MVISVAIDKAALQHNLKCVRQYAPQQKVLAMIKANGYGHGLLTVADALSSAEGFGVARLSEALILRRAGFDQTIVVMEGFQDLAALQLFVSQQMVPVIHHWEQIQMLESIVLPQPLKIWLKLDVGMHRLGFLPEEFLQAYHRLSQCHQVQQPFTLMSHLSHAFLRDNIETDKQITLFSDCVANIPGEKTLAHSAAILRYPKAHHDWVRPGLMLYGVSPLEGYCGKDLSLQPVMQFHSTISVRRHLPAGATIGYGGCFTCPEAMPVGVVPIGYGDGYPRHIEPGTPVWVNGHALPILGVVSMDRLIIDLRSYPAAKVGEFVQLWGAHLPVEKIAQHAHTSPYELLTQITARAYDHGA